MTAPDVSVLVVNYNTASLIRPMMEALQASAESAGCSLQTIILDNASRDQSRAELQTWSPHVELIFNDENVGFGRANNQCLELAKGRYVLLLNTDAFVSEDTLGKTLSFMGSHPACGILGVRLVGRDGALQPSCRYFPTVLNTFISNIGMTRWFPWIRAVDDMVWNHAQTRECDWVPGCYYLVRRELVTQVGLFDKRYFLYYEEVDHCRAAKSAGWEVFYFHDTSVIHLGGESAKSDGVLTDGARQISALQVESELLYFRKHEGPTGLIVHLMLTTLAMAIQAVKGFIRGRGAEHGRVRWRNVVQMWSLAQRTAWGNRPTR